MIKRSNKQQQPPLLKSEHNDDRPRNLTAALKATCGGNLRTPRADYQNSDAFARVVCIWRLGGVQFDFARLETEPLNLFVRQNSFEPEDFICQGAMAEHQKLCLLVRFAAVANSGRRDYRAREQRSANPSVA